MIPNAVVIIPARYTSTRLPGKPLIQLCGKPLIQWVYEAAKKVNALHSPIVATDDKRIFNTVEQFGGKALMTPESCENGSERVGFVAKNLEADIVVNLQGDEPLVDVEAINKAVNILSENVNIPVATLGFPLNNEADWQKSSVVKAIRNQNGDVLYFSRSPIPYFREGKIEEVSNLFRHIGVYIYNRQFLLNFLSWQTAEIEAVECLEQLRILDKGYPIRMVEAGFVSIGVDIPEDIPIVEKLLAEKGKVF